MKNESSPARRKAAASKTTIVRVALGRRSYSIRIRPGLLAEAANEKFGLSSLSRLAVVTDENVEPLYAESFCRSFEPTASRIDLFVIPAGETSKSAEMLRVLWEGFLAGSLDRDAAVVALGGGVVGDLAGFAAATYARGIRFFQIPTTLLAMVDSSVGGKTAIDLDGGKNMVGAFHQPFGVLIDSETLHTLPEREYRAGLGEVVKYAVSLDASFFDFLEKNAAAVARRDHSVLCELIARCCRMKAAIVRADERETSGLRAILNYGHTFAHTYEIGAGYRGLLHGEAVALGLSDALRLANRLARTDRRFERIDAALVRRQEKLFRALGLADALSEIVPIRKNAAWEPQARLDAMRRDKKSADGRIRLVLPIDLGASRLFDDIPEKPILEILRRRITR